MMTHTRSALLFATVLTALVAVGLVVVHQHSGVLLVEAGLSMLLSPVLTLGACWGGPKTHPILNQHALLVNSLIGICLTAVWFTLLVLGTFQEFLFFGLLMMGLLFFAMVSLSELFLKSALTIKTISCTPETQTFFPSETAQTHRHIVHTLTMDKGNTKVRFVTRSPRGPRLHARVQQDQTHLILTPEDLLVVVNVLFQKQKEQGKNHTFGMIPTTSIGTPSLFLDEHAGSWRDRLRDNPHLAKGVLPGAWFEDALTTLLKQGHLKAFPMATWVVIELPDPQPLSHHDKIRFDRVMRRLDEAGEGHERPLSPPPCTDVSQKIV